ncbi:MAG: outer membrane protein assembly factor BamE, partial [Thermoanaerobaculia bacterium]
CYLLEKILYATKGRAMISKLPSILLIVALVSIGCASTGKAVAKLEPGMTKQQIIDILGSPADRSFRGSDEAWQYQEIAGFGQCKYTTVWISEGKLVGISTRRGGSVAGCGLGSQSVDWSQMPPAAGTHI